MQTLPGAGERCVDLDPELALLLDDPQWVREEFEVLMAAEWPQRIVRVPLTRTATGAGPTGPDGRRPARGARLRKPPSRAHAPGTDGWVRERSPPRGGAHSSDRPNEA
ncbi:hypothetical protein [Cumulibacter manganitolerans]|uniref:hypothetical protein n=1 Tax=Cumulibacter manganitolerans TaxID=1884992 RepID=UPI001294B2F6|nr:hypothetical protein [Cumulibacter manganitolerans]